MKAKEYETLISDLQVGYTLLIKQNKADSKKFLCRVTHYAQPDRDITLKVIGEVDEQGQERAIERGSSFNIDVIKLKRYHIVRVFSRNPNKLDEYLRRQA